jgi:methylenetetrahydrofolate--tRNA-(uracil-5-)-methyltransferase
MLGGLLSHLQHADPTHFQPMNANGGLLAPLERPPRDRALRKAALAERALAAMRDFAREIAA